MSVGFTTTKADLDQRAGAIALDLRSVLYRVQIFKAYLDTVTVAQLQALGYATSPDEASQLKSAFTDMDKLRTIYEGTATQATTYDFRTFSKLLTGVV
jgi:hypothetical protein